MKELKIPIIYAPTATGKTEIIMHLSESMDFEICSMDSMQVYKQMNIGTAKPTSEELDKFPHHLINIVYPDEEYDVNKYRNDAMAIVDDVTSRGKLPLFVGGTGLYMDILRYGLFKGIKRDDDLRRALEKKENESPGILMRMLSIVDPESAASIHSNDLKRKVRALEVYFKSGEKFSTMGQKRLPDDRFVLICLSRDRQEIYTRINRRVEIMIKKGLIEETIALMKAYSPDLQSMKAIGYRETIAYLNGGYSSKDDYVDTLQKNTRHFAKRQIIWARRYEEMQTVFVDSNNISRTCENLKEIILPLEQV